MNFEIPEPIQSIKPKAPTPRTHAESSSEILIDNPTEVRTGEELDLNQLELFLKDSIPGTEGKLSVQQFPSGYSNLTYLIRIGNKDFVLRRPPFGRKAKTAHDMGREYKILNGIGKVFKYCPKPLVYAEDESIIGAPFYVMERINGIILRKDLPKGLSYSPTAMRQLCENLIDVHVALHSIDYQAAGLEDLGHPEGYVQRQIEGWSERYTTARTQDAPTFESIIQWLNDHIPFNSPKATLIHNDYKFDNVVLDENNPTQIIGVLDWEMTTIGDPLMDLGSSLGYWIEKNDSSPMQMIRRLPTAEEGAMTRQEVIDSYAKKSGIAIDNFDFYYTFGLFRLAGIAQQIYYRYFHGQTKDKRFASLIYAVQILEHLANTVIEKSKL
ncbi:phosphotransferase family protein [Deltaproteobacteria bacterium TL4]